MRIIHNQALGPILVQVPHEARLAVTPTASQRQAESAEQLVAQRKLLFIVFRSHNRQDRRGASSADHVANAHGLARTRISDNDMPGTLVPGRTQHGLEAAL